MQVIRVTNPNGIDDLKLIADSESDASFIRQLADAGSLISLSRVAGSTVTFRPIPVGNAQLGALISTGSVGKMNIVLSQNQNFQVVLTFKSAGVPMDLTLYSAIKLQFYNQRKTAAVISLSLGAGLTISGDDNEILTIALTPAQTVILCNQEYYYDLLTIAGGNNTYLLEGKAVIDKTVTR